VYLETKGVQAEVIVIDNGSSDGSAEMIKKEFPVVNLIVNEENRGFAAANNQGMAIAQGRYVLLLNSDTIVLDNVISKTISFADNHPEAAIVGCMVMNPDKSLQPTCFMFPSILNMLLSASYLYKLFPKSKFFGREQMSWWDRNDVREVDVVTGCFMLVRQEAIKQIGTMDEQFFMYADETDWCYRFRQAGWKALFTPDAKIIHLGGASSKSLRAEMILQTRASILLFFQKHRSTFSYYLACVAFSIHALIRIPYWLLRAIFEVKNRESHWLRVKTYASGTLKPLGGWRKLCHPSRQL
jgi:GT2 family glycosyltransferase